MFRFYIYCCCTFGAAHVLPVDIVVMDVAVYLLLLFVIGMKHNVCVGEGSSR